ncbi:MAG: hypothetical protein ACT4QG_16455 [Sporichthyaceae bacterium]
MAVQLRWSLIWQVRNGGQRRMVERMQMATYIDETRYAVDSLVAPMWHEREAESILANRLDTLAAEVADGYGRAAWLALNPDLDDEGLGTLIHYETYFGPDKEQHLVQGEIDAVRQRLQARTFAVGSLAGALLQLGKQGISLAHGGLARCPRGRAVGQQDLSNVVWQARNQALHWEEGELRAPVIACFAQLATDFGPRFDEPKAQNLAFAVIEVLGWRTSENVLDDWALLS